jgi:hypothetical protein
MRRIFSQVRQKNSSTRARSRMPTWPTLKSTIASSRSCTASW